MLIEQPSCRKKKLGDVAPSNRLSAQTHTPEYRIDDFFLSLFSLLLVLRVNIVTDRLFGMAGARPDENNKPMKNQCCANSFTIVRFRWIFWYVETLENSFANKSEEKKRNLLRFGSWIWCYACRFTRDVGDDGDDDDDDTHTSIGA